MHKKLTTQQQKQNQESLLDLRVSLRAKRGFHSPQETNNNNNKHS